MFPEVRYSFLHSRDFFSERIPENFRTRMSRGASLGGLWVRDAVTFLSWTKWTKFNSENPNSRVLLRKE